MEAVVNKDQEIRKAAVPLGLILGLISLILGIFSFYFVTGMTSSVIMMLASPFLFSILIPIIIAVFFCIDLRKKIGGYWNFRQATSGIFIMFFISTLVTTIGTNFIFAKFIEPDMVDKTKVAMVDAVTSLMEKSNAPQEKIDKSVSDMEKQFDEQKDLTVGKFFKSFGVSVIVVFFVSLIFGAIFKREPPIYLQDSEPDLMV